MYIGYMGDIVFSVAASRMLTPKDYEREGAARWAEHDLILRKPVAQFGGANLEKLSFSIILDAAHGIDIEKELKKLRKMRDKGAVFPLVIGGTPVTQNYWRLDSMKEGNFFWSASGKPIQCTVAVSLTEYEDGNAIEENAIAMGGGTS